MKTTIKLGDKVKDVVTGLEGIVISRIEYITGCEQCGVSPPAKDGKILDAAYIDHTRLQVIGEAIVLPVQAHAMPPGGPMFDAPRH